MQLHAKALIPASAAAVAAAGLAAWLILSGGAPGSSPAQPPHPGPSASSPLRSPFTGEPVTALRPVLAVKIDNLVDARPQTGLTSADIVYVLPVEGGLSRFMAVFSSRSPPVLGPVRSARLEDLPLLRQFGRPAFAYSGASPTALPVIQRARIADLADGHAGGYFRDSRRAAPHNLYARTSQLLAEAKSASLARDIGFRFGPPPAGGQAARSRSVAYPAAAFRFTWSAARGRWLVSIDGTPAASTGGGRLSAATVVIQYTVITIPPVTGPHPPTPYAQTTGTGRAVVLRDGRAYQVRWSRPAADGGTGFRTASGQQMTFARGPVWVVLAQR
jgi:hypothetical protein